MPEVKSFKKGVGWLFPMKDGPIKGAEYRLPLVRNGTAQQQYDALPEEIHLAGGLRYVRVPACKKDGTRRMAKADKTEFPMFEYVEGDPF